MFKASRGFEFVGGESCADASAEDAFRSSRRRFAEVFWAVVVGNAVMIVASLEIQRMRRPPWRHLGVRRIGE
jgi:hypothetical protein